MVVAMEFRITEKNTKIMIFLKYQSRNYCIKSIQERIIEQPLTKPTRMIINRLLPNKFTQNTQKSIILLNHQQKAIEAMKLKKPAMEEEAAVIETKVNCMMMRCTDCKSKKC